MLILTRRRNERIKIGDNDYLNVIFLNSKSQEVIIEKTLDGVEQPLTTLNPFDCVTDIGECRVKMLDVKGNQVRLGFLAPPHIHIVRTELLDKPYPGDGRFN